MVEVAVSEFRANMNSVLQLVQEGEIVSLTSRGVEVARIVPPGMAQEIARRELERLRATAVVGDVLSPVEDAGEWEAVESLSAKR